MKTELSAEKAAFALRVDESTVHRWIREGKVPFKFQDGRKVIRETAVTQIKNLMESHGSNWHQYAKWTSFDRFECQTFTLDKIVPALGEKVPPPSKFKQLAEMAKQLQLMGESNLAAHVSLRAVEMM